MHGRIVLGLHRAKRNARRAGAAGGPSIERLRVSRLRRYPHLETERAGNLIHQPIAHGGRQSRHRIWRPTRRSERVVVVTRHAELGFGHVVPGGEIGVGQRPVDADTVTASQLEVGRKKTQRRAEPMPRGAADQPQIGAAEWIGPILPNVGILDRGRAPGMGDACIGCLRHPDRCLLQSFQGNAAINVRAGLDDGHPCSGASQAPGDERAGNAGADNHDVAVLRQRSLFKYWKAPKPSRWDRRRTCPAAGSIRLPATSKSSDSFVRPAIRRS